MKMIRIKLLTVLISIFLLYSCNEKKKSIALEEKSETKKEIQKIPILNLGTFHMGLTTDAHTTKFDENNIENRKKIHEIAKKIALFRPSVILVETVPEYDETLQTLYNEYLENPDMFFKNPSEVQLLAYELGRLSNTERIYGIDHKMSYNYMIAKEVENSIDSTFINNFYMNPIQFYPEINVDEETLNLLDKLKLNNNEDYLNYLMTMNADVMTHVGTVKGFEGADEATKYYQRNLRMYSNLNRIKLKNNDRVFILMGASHTAFFRDFISRSPKYEMVNTFDYLK